MKINLGKSDGSQVCMDLDRLIVSRLLVQANSGGGKSWALRRLLEQSHGHVQHLILDIEGEFHTLRERYDYVLAARIGGDTLADIRTAPLLARRLLELGVSAILDLYELKAHERIRFVKLFLEALINAPRQLWHPCLVVVDEAHHFCPEKGDAESSGAVVDLMTRGRKRGFCGVLATQRLSKLRKDAAAEANIKLIGRAALDVDMDRAGEELGFKRNERDVLRRLAPGHFFAFGPGLSDQVVEVHIGPVETTHPKPGQGAAPIPPARDKVRAVLAKLADLPKEAEEEVRTMAGLRSQIAHLQRDLAAKQKPPTPVVERIEVQAVSGDTVARLQSAVADLAAISREISGALSGVSPPARPAPQHRPPPVPSIVPGKPRGQTVDASPGGELNGPEKRILDALAWLESIGNTEPEQAAVAFLAGYSVGGGAFNNPRGRLNQRGLLQYLPGGCMTLTPAGRELAHAPDVPLTTEELHRRVLERLPGPEQRILRPLLEAYPESITNPDLARAAGYEPNGGAYNNPRGRLKTLGLIEYRNGQVVARPLLFLER